MPVRRVLLLSILLILVAYNLWRYNHQRHLAGTSTVSTTQPRLTDPSATAAAMWNAYDQAATLADAPDAQFQPAFDNVRTQSASIDSPNLKPNADTLADIRGCMTWLMFYRQNVNKPHPDAAWKNRALSHLQSCKQNHADIAR